eukprot:scaffold1398_cov259-Pinguiococcus_pyrenoidosus.AAC.13
MHGVFPVSLPQKKPRASLPARHMHHSPSFKPQPRAPRALSSYDEKGRHAAARTTQADAALGAVRQRNWCKSGESPDTKSGPWVRTVGPEGSGAALRSFVQDRQVSCTESKQSLGVRERQSASSRESGAA